MQFHISRNAVVIGRYTHEELDQAIARQDVRPGDLYWIEGAAGWMPVTELAQFAGRTPPPPPASVPPAAQTARTFDPNEMVCARCGGRSTARHFDDSSFAPRGSGSYWFLIIIFFPISLLYYMHVESKYKSAKCCPSCGADALMPASGQAARGR